MTQSSYTPYSQPQSDSTTGTQKSKKKSKPKRNKANLVPAYFFWVILFLGSIGLNIYNVYNRFAPETVERFIASGIYEFIFSLPVFSLIGFLVRLVALIAIGYVLRVMHQNLLWSNPVWWIILFCSAFVLVVGLPQLLMSIPFVMAVSIVGLIQYLEILFWDAKKKTTWLWIVVVTAYVVEIWMQYDMLPFHQDYETALGLLKGMMSMSFEWENFKPIQGLLAILGIFGIEAGDRLLKLVKQHV